MKLVAAVILVCALGAALAAQVNVSGDWAVEFHTEYGKGRTVMSLVQEGTKVTGYMTTERNETPVKGTIEGDTFRVVWEQPIEGTIVQVTFEATVKDGTMNGIVRLGTFAEGPFYAERR